MKKLFVLFLMVLVGIGLSFTKSKADENRSIPYVYGFALHANTLIVGHGGTLHKISGVASASNTVWSIHDASSIANATGATNAITNIIVEGGEATQYDALVPIDYGDEGMPFVNGLVVITTTADITVAYK